MIETYILEQLAAFAEYGTLSEAAEQLHISQPSLSRSMQKLENTLNVSLFDRTSNRISLNETGRLAAEYAEKIIMLETEMENRIHAFDKSLHSLTIGSCAPGPLMRLLPAAMGLYPDMTVSSIVKPEETLLAGLEHSEYAVIILDHDLNPEAHHVQKYISEQLYISVDSSHPAVNQKSVSFSEMDGQKFIMYAQTGIWDELMRRKMPHATFYRQENMDAVGDLAKFSSLPSFSTSISQKSLPSRQNGRINIPFSDTESCIDFYCICKAEEYSKWKALFEAITI